MYRTGTTAGNPTQIDVYLQYPFNACSGVVELVFVQLASDQVLCLANVFDVMTVFRRLHSYESSTASISCVCHLMAASV